LRAIVPAIPAGGPHRLLPHPTAPADAVQELTVTVRRPAPETLRLDFHLAGDIAALRLPEPRPAVRSDGLWRHSCFEAFIGHRAASDYWEYNFSPSSAWAAYHFTAYREGMAPLLKGAAPVIDFHSAVQSIDMSVTVDLSWLARTAGGVQLQLGLAAVIEDKGRNLSYWALAHTAEKPDFHDAGARILSLD
jgi:hypothetical protein